MKKSVKLFVIVAVLVALIATVIVLAIFLKEPENVDQNDGSDGVSNVVSDGDSDVTPEGENQVGPQMDVLGYSALHLETIEQFSEFAESGEYECHLGNDQSGGSIYHVSILGQDAVVTYYFDDKGKTTDFEAFYYLNADIENLDSITVNDISLEEISDLCQETVSRFCLMFECVDVPDIYLSNQDGTFTLIENAANFQSLADGLSYLAFSIRDESGYLWELNLYSNEGLITANVRKYFNVEETKNYIANISLYEGE